MESKKKEPTDYELLMELEQLESLKEELEELEIRTIDELAGRIRALHARLDERERD